MNRPTERFRQSGQRLIRHFAPGGTVTLRRRHTLRDPLNGQVISTLAVDGLTAADSAEIDLDATNLAGSIIPGVTFTIAGDATVYTVENTVGAISNQLAGVQILPPLAQAAANDAVVTLGSIYADVEIRAAVTRFADEVIDGSRILATDRMVVIDVKELSVDIGPETEIVVGELVYQFKDILPISPGLERYALRLHVGRA